MFPSFVYQSLATDMQLVFPHAQRGTTRVSRATTTFGSSGGLVSVHLHMQSATLSWQIDGSDCQDCQLSSFFEGLPLYSNSSCNSNPNFSCSPMPMPMAVTVAPRFVCAAAVLHEYAWAVASHQNMPHEIKKKQQQEGEWEWENGKEQL